MPKELLAQVVANLRSITAPHPSMAHVQDAIADVPACVFVADTQGRLVAASKLALAVVDHTLSSLRALSITDISAADELQEVEQLWESFLRYHQQSGEFVLRRRDGTEVRTRYAAATNVAAGLSVAVHLPLE